MCEKPSTPHNSKACRATFSSGNLNYLFSGCLCRCPNIVVKEYAGFGQEGLPSEPGPAQGFFLFLATVGFAMCWAHALGCWQMYRDNLCCNRHINKLFLFKTFFHLGLSAFVHVLPHYNSGWDLNLGWVIATHWFFSFSATLWYICCVLLIIFLLHEPLSARL